MDAGHRAPLQHPADAIDHIEVITSPSAQYKPDGTAGIINIVMKKKRTTGSAGSVKLSVGDNGRFGVGVTESATVKNFSFSGSFNFRRDYRPRTATDIRNYTDPTTGLPASTTTRTLEFARPNFEVAQLKADDQLSKWNRFSQTIDYSVRDFDRFADETDSSLIAGVPGLYDRLRRDPETERDVEMESSFEHQFGREDHTLDVDFRWAHHTETENNHYQNIYSIPVQATTYDTNKNFVNEPTTEESVSYANVLSSSTKVEFGLDRTDDRSGQNHQGADLDPVSGLWVNDPAITNNFVLKRGVTALYGTYRQTLGSLGVMPGLRFESTDQSTDLVAEKLVSQQTYLRLYPTLHLTYDLTPTDQLQLNYSHRVHRPDNDDLNPFPENQDPYNVRVGNPDLRPEEVHMIETGYQYKNDDTTYLASLFYKYSYNGFTTVSRYINSTTLLTTEENISKNQSGGLEVAATANPWKALTVNASGNVFYNQIDASNLGFTTNKSTIAWAGKLSADYSLSKSTSFQINSNYTARRLTPQGYRMPTVVANIGFKHEIKSKNLTLVFTVSDLFASLKEETRLDTPALHDDYTRRRSSRIFYGGIVYSFGSGKKKKDDSMQFDNSL